MKKFNDEWVTYEDPAIYDGWILKFNYALNDFVWRDHWVVDNLSDTQRKEIEDDIYRILNEG